jgi:hypothetical protein
MISVGFSHRMTNGMIIKPFGEESISMLQGNIKDAPITDYICALLEKDSSKISGGGDFLERVQKASITNGKMIAVPHNPRLWNLITMITNEYSKNKSVLEVWAVLMKEGDFHMLHSHQKPGSATGVVYEKSKFEGVSGAFYLKIPEKKPPQGNVNFVLDDKVFSWSPKDGDYFVWPSYVIHGVYPFKGPGSRIMISWNSI